jgi:MFS family permease
MSNDLQRTFFGWRVVAGAFVIAVLGWGLGFYGPPVYLHAVREARGWSVGFVSAAVTLHFVSGALVVANLPRLYARFGLRTVTRCGAALLALGLVGWAVALAQWQLLIATLFTGAGWVTLGAAAINAMVSPWFVRDRPKALSTAYNGASVGGIIFSPLWVVLIEGLGFATAAAIVGLVAFLAVWWLTASVVATRPEDLGQFADGLAAAPETAKPVLAGAVGVSLWRRRSFQTLAAGMALGLFAQIGLIAQLFSLIAPALGAKAAGLLAGLATASAIAGRTAFGWLMPPSADRRIAAVLSYAIQIGGIVLLIVADGQSAALLTAGVLLFGFGIGNATSLPPLIAQAEFDRAETARAVALVIATAQFAYAFAPAVFGLLREWSGGSAAVFVLAIAVKALAIASFLAGRR